MTIPFWCLLAAIVLPIVLALSGGYFRMRELGGIDNKHPRAQAAKLTGAGARIYAAQANAWEQLPVFATSVFVAHLAGADPGRAALLSVVFVLARVAHAVVYVANLDVLRSLVFLVGLVCCLGLFVISC